MKIWHYHPRTGVLLEEGTAQPSPREPGQFLTPAWATRIAPPPAQDGHVRKFDGAAWSQVPIPPTFEEELAAADILPF